MGFLRNLLTGRDNETLAIGRVLGVVLYLNALILIPAVIVAALLGRKVEPATWFTLLASLGVYVPLCAAAVAGLISGTAFTEPPAAAAGTTTSVVASTTTTAPVVQQNDSPAC